jgi:glutamate synthase (NADPH) small chain
MADPFGFLAYPREAAAPLASRDSSSFEETYGYLPSERLDRQARRCLDCGTPFCEVHGCPAGNRIPDWIYMVVGDKWRAALDLLHSTDNFPEFTGRLCAAPCEDACVLGISFEGVTIKQIELEIAERGWLEGWIVAEPPLFQTGRKIAVVGSGPAGLAAAQQLARSGHTVTVFDRDDRVGGILRYGIPDFALSKRVLDRRIDQLIEEGVTFETGVDVGVDLSIGYLKRTFDVVVILTGSRTPKDIIVPGRSLGGIHFAMNFLAQANRTAAGDFVAEDEIIDARGKRVAVIGGGETGAYCAGTSRRMGASEVIKIELRPSPDRNAPPGEWPFRKIARPVDDPLSDGAVIRWGAKVERFVGKDGAVSGLELKVRDSAKSSHIETVDAELVILALGFEHVERGPLVTNLSLATDDRGNLRIDDRCMTSEEGVFAAGDCVLGVSSVVQAIAQGRRVAEAVNRFLGDR